MLGILDGFLFEIGKFLAWICGMLLLGVGWVSLELFLNYKRK